MSKPTPLGQQPPGYNWFPILARLLWLGSLILHWQAGRIERWAVAAEEQARWARTDLLASTLGDLAGAVLPVVRSPWPGWIALGGAVLLFGEAVLAGLTLTWARNRVPRPDVVVLRIRAPRGSAPRSGGGGRASDEDLFRALHSLLPAGSPVRLACLLAGRPDQGAVLEVHLAGGTADQRAGAAAAVQKVVLGQLPEAVIDERPDGLGAALEPGRWLARREVGLRRAAHEPLRFGDDAARDLLGPLAAALQPPAGAVYAEVQLVLRPRRDWALTEGWRAAGLRQLLRLKAKQRYSLADEAARLERKLDSPAFDTTIRLVVVAEERRAATAALDQMGAAIGQYNARSGMGAQGLRVVRGGRAVQLAGDADIQRQRVVRQILARLPRVAPPPALLWPLRWWQPAPILTPDELRGL